MNESKYGLGVELPLDHQEALERTIEALRNEGFGVLTTIDVQYTLKQKLGRDFRKYAILGACNPALADRALQADIEIGLLLPCNVIVYELSPGRTAVSAMAPLAALGLAGHHAALREVAGEADVRLRRALDTLESGASSHEPTEGHAHDRA